MFINLETGGAVYVVAHAHDVTYSPEPGGFDGDQSKHAYSVVPSAAFFAAHREATREEIDAAAGAPAAAAADAETDAAADAETDAGTDAPRKLKGKDSGREERHHRDE